MWSLFFLSFGMFCISLSFGGCPTQTTMKIKRFFPFKDHDSLSPLFQCSVWLAEVFSSIPPKKKCLHPFFDNCSKWSLRKTKIGKRSVKFSLPAADFGICQSPMAMFMGEKDDFDTMLEQISVRPGCLPNSPFSGVKFKSRFYSILGKL